MSKNVVFYCKGFSGKVNFSKMMHISRLYINSSGTWSNKSLAFFIHNTNYQILLKTSHYDPHIAD